MFSPNDIKLMSMAFEDVCKILNLPNGRHPSREVIAARIIDLARRGERSPTRLRDRVLHEADLAEKVDLGDEDSLKGLNSKIRVVVFVLTRLVCMSHYHVKFFKTLLSSNGHSHKCEQGAVDIEGANCSEEAIQAAWTKYDRVTNGCARHRADIAEAQLLELHI